MVTVGVRGFVQATTAVSASKRRRSGIGPMTIPTAFLRGHECLKQTCVCPSARPSACLFADPYGLPGLKLMTML